MRDVNQLNMQQTTKGKTVNKKQDFIGNLCMEKTKGKTKLIGNRGFHW